MLAGRLFQAFGKYKENRKIVILRIMELDVCYWVLLIYWEKNFKAEDDQKFNLGSG